ncbi:MAG: 30S ribosomal protein S6 [Patescibacteria group bacterium]
MSKAVVNQEEELGVNRVYELGYLLSPLIPSESLTDKVNQDLKALVNGFGGEIIGDNPLPAMITLAYPIKKVVDHKGLTCREAYFGAFRFRLNSSALPELIAKLKELNDLIRYLLLEVPKATLVDEENLRNRKRVVPPTPTTEGEGPAKPVMSADEMDKEIDQLLTTESYVSK